MKKWHFQQPQKKKKNYTQEDKCIMYRSFDGHLNPWRKFQTTMESSIFCVLFSTLVTVCVCVQLCVCVCDCSTELCIAIESYQNRKKKKNTISRVTHFKCWGRASFQCLVYTAAALWQTASRVLICIEHARGWKEHRRPLKTVLTIGTNIKKLLEISELHSLW